MIGITFLFAGRIKEKHYNDAVNEYLKRLSMYSSHSLIEIKEEKLPEGPSKTQVEAALLKEADEIISKIRKGAYVIALSSEGRQMSSEALSDKLTEISSFNSKICVIIGSSHGLHQSVKSKADLLLSLSPMTFSHSMARVLVLEQLYRGFNIAAGGKYHK